jgi:hypothetical protein
MSNTRSGCYTLGDQRVHGLCGLTLRPHWLEIEDRASRGHRTALHPLGFQIDEEPPFSVRAVVDLVGGLAPDVGSDVIESSGVPGIFCYLMLGVVMPEGDIGPILQMELLASNRRGPVLGGDMTERVFPLDLKVSHEHLVFLGAFGLEGGWLGG